MQSMQTCSTQLRLTCEDYPTSSEALVSLGISQCEILVRNWWERGEKVGIFGPPDFSLWDHFWLAAFIVLQWSHSC